MIKRIYFIIVLIALFQVNWMFGQDEIDPDELDGRTISEEFNIINYAVPFLTIAPDSRAGGMGDVGAATSPDINSMHWNPAKYAMIDGDGGIALSYTPWLRKLVDDINLLYLPGYFRLDDRQVFSASLLYFSLGEINFTGIDGMPQGSFNPNEFALDAAYSRLFSEKIAGSVALRLIRSDLVGNVANIDSKPGWSYAADVSMYYQTDLEIDEKESEFAFGVNISNMGAKMSYSIDNQQDEFIPTNLKLGSRLTMNLDEYNKISFALDLNKLLVTTPQKFIGDTAIGKGDADASLPKSMVLSFFDAPRGFSEEMEEMMVSAGVEYWYSDQFAIRGGYFYEHENKGNRKYFTLGIGLKLNVVAMDFAYLVPTSGRQNPLANTMRFTLLFEFNKFGK